MLQTTFENLPEIVNNMPKYLYSFATTSFTFAIKKFYTTNESQEVSPFPAGDHKAHIKRRAQRHNKHKTEQKHKRSTK